MATVKQHGAAFLPLVDPEKTPPEQAGIFAARCEKAGADGILVGGSTLQQDTLDATLLAMRAVTTIPIVLFPGGAAQLSPHADAVLFMSLLSGRNPEYLVDNQVKGAPLIKKYKLEPIPTAYLLISSGMVTAVQYVSKTEPLSRDDIDSVQAHALCAAYFGMKLVYLEAGSGADASVPDALIRGVVAYAGIPVMTGGGIRTPQEAAAKVAAGASFIVVGTAMEAEGTFEQLTAFAQAVHSS